MKQVFFNTLSEAQQQAMLAQPESGMGYQILGGAPGQTATLGPLTVVSNSEYVSYFEDPQNSPVLLEHSQLERAPALPLGLPGLSVLRNPKYDGYELLCLIELIVEELTETLPPFAKLTKPGDEFIRLSAYQDDKRLKGGLVQAGTYTTTPLDMDDTPSGLAAVGRYALPNRMAAVHKFRISPPAGTLVLYGTVTPNYGMSGGGVEVYFPCGIPQPGHVKYEGEIPVM